MSLRWRIAFAMAAIAAVTAIAFGAATYRSTRQRLLAEVDRSLIAIDNLGLGRDPLPDRGPLLGLDAQVLGPTGAIRETTFPTAIPVTDADRALIGQRTSRFATVSTDAGEYRVRTIGLPRGAVQVGRSLDETSRVLASLRMRTLLLGAVVSGLAAALGLWIAGRVTASLRRLTVAAEHVETTGRLDIGVADGAGNDEVGRLSVAFDRMLAALARSKSEQERLVQDAGHELRTPLTSLRTNLDTLRRFPDMPLGDREAIVADLHAETEELTALVNEVVDVASGGGSDDPFESFDLADVVRDVASRYARRTDRPIVVEAAPSPVVAQLSGVQRAVSCLIDNACKFDVSGGPIEVSVVGVEVVVADHGDGIPVWDLPLVFERFHRADAARSMQGSGLGLSIVRDVARRHGGDAFASNRPDGGAVVGFRLAASAPG